MTLQNKEEDKDIPTACVLFAMVGVGYLFPFSALTQPVDYWNLIFPDFNIEFPLTTLYLWSNLVCLGLVVFLGGEPSYTLRIVCGFCGQLLVLALVPTFYFFHFSEPVHYVLVMAATAFVACATALVDSVVISFSAQYPLRVQESLQFGVGLSTLIGSAYRIITKATFPPTMVVESSLLYFYCGAATILLCIGAYYYLLVLPLSKKYLRFGVVGSSNAAYEAIESEQSDAESNQYVMVSSTLHPKLSPDLSMYKTRRASFRKESAALQSPEGNRMKATSSSEDLRKPLNGQGMSTPNTYGGIEMIENKKSIGSSDTSRIGAAGEDADAPLNKWALLRKAAFNEFFVFLLFFSTLLLWPPLVTEIKSFNFPHLQETRWWPLLLLGLFSLADCIGRSASQFRMGLTADNVWIAVLLRFSLFPLIICTVKGIYFTHDFFSVLFVFLLGFTNGYLGTLTIVMVNDRLQEHEKGVVGTFTGFFLNCGLVVGASCADIVERLVLG